MKTRTTRTTARSDTLPARSASQVMGILRAATEMETETPSAPAGVPTGLWKTGWLAQPVQPLQPALAEGGA